jgi:hypothetical protein
VIGITLFFIQVAILFHIHFLSWWVINAQTCYTVKTQCVFEKKRKKGQRYCYKPTDMSCKQKGKELQHTSILIVLKPFCAPSCYKWQLLVFVRQHVERWHLMGSFILPCNNVSISIAYSSIILSPRVKYSCDSQFCSILCK